MTKRVTLAPGTNCEVLFDLLTAARGRLVAGRLLKGTDVGRFVTLREISKPRRGLDAAVDVARSLAHPRIVKVLGIVQGESQSYVASEYVPGAALSELSAAVRHENAPLDPAVAVHVISEALQGVALSQRMLKENAGVSYTRSFHADTVWLAEYGDVLVTEVGLAPFLSEAFPARTEAEAASVDVLTGAVELFQLLTGRIMTEEMVASLVDHVPLPVAKVLSRALSAPESFGGPEGLANALAELPPAFRADAELVSDELVRVLRPALERRRRTLSALQQAASRGDDEESTQFFRQADLFESTRCDTARPPPDASSESVPPTLREQGGLDEPTRIFRPDPPARSAPPLSESPGRRSPASRRAPFAAGGNAEDDDRTVKEQARFELTSEPPRPSYRDIDPSIFRPRRTRLRWVGSVFLLIVLMAVVAAWLKPIWLPHGLG